MDLIINQLSGTGLPLLGNDIDTDRIMPARYLKELTFSNLGSYVFADEISEVANNETPHPFADKQFQNASFLVVNSNFGCGSSREHAPQGIKRWGIDCIIGESYSEIFFANCSAIGLPCLTLSQEDVKTIQEQIAKNSEEKISLDLTKESLKVGDKVFQYKLDGGLKDSFISGKWDLTARLLANTAEIHEKKAQLIYT